METAFPGLEPDSSLPQTYNTAACDVMRGHVGDVLEFLSDVHTLSKVKSSVNGQTIGLNSDTLGGILKASLAQYLALEISKGNERDTDKEKKYVIVNLS